MTWNIAISCTDKLGRQDPRERISHVGGVNPDGTLWRLLVSVAIAGAKEGRWKFWTMTKGESVRVIVARTASGQEYLKTEVDGDEPCGLLILPECATDRLHRHARRW